MFLAIVRFELAYWFRRPLTLLFFVLFFVMAFRSTAVGLDLATGPIHRNAPFVLAYAMGIITSLGVIITAAIAGTAVLRDAQLGTEEMLYTTRLSKPGYLLGRFTATFLVMLVIYAGLPIGLLVGTLMPWVPADKLGPISLWSVVQPFLLIAVPNLLFVSALLFAVGALTRRLFAVYITGVVLVAIWDISQEVIQQLDKLRLAALVDPFTLETNEVVVRYWSVAEKNDRMMPVTGIMLENRLLWIAIALALFALVAAIFRLRLQESRGKKGKEVGDVPVAVARVPLVALSFAGLSWTRAFVRQALFHFQSIVRETPFRAISIICVILLMFSEWEAGHAADLTRLWPVTSIVAPTIANRLFIFIILLATLYGGELVWRERQLKADQMQDAMPVPEWVTFGGKLAAVFLAVVVLVVLGIASGMIMQVAQGYTRVQLGVYLQIVGFVAVPVALAIVALAMGVHALVNQKFVGHLILVSYWVIVSAASNLRLDYGLYLVGRPANFTYSDMAGWGPYLPRLFVVDLYSVAFCLVVAALGYLALVRGTDTSWSRRRRVAGQRWRAGAGLAMGAFAVATLALATVFVYNANILNGSPSMHAAEQQMKAWELKYKPLAGLPQPRIVGVSLHHDYFPERRAAAWHGTLRAVNRTMRPVDTLFVSLKGAGPTLTSLHNWILSNTGLSLDSLAIDRTATLVDDDLRNGVRLYRLSPPLAPGESLTVRFASRLEPRGFPNGAFNNDVSSNGSFINATYLPSFGYWEENELGDDDVRRRNGLTPKRMRALDDPAMRDNNWTGTDWISFDETTCTSPDQISIAPGYLQTEWMENGRRCFRYVMDKPILEDFSTLSARYAVKRETYHGVALEIYYHPEHTFALPSMLLASKDGLDYFSKNFSPYLYRQYRIIEIPRYMGVDAESFPNTVPYSEGAGFIERKQEGDDQIDPAYFITAHELAHQWWPAQVVGGFGQGDNMTSEGLAEYSALTVMEKRFGREATQKFLRWDLDRYLSGRGNERKKELPLLYVEDQPYIHYRKGALAFYALRDYIGESAMNTALRAYVNKWALKGPPYVTSRDLYAELDHVTPDSLKYVLRDLFEEITFYENRADSAVATKRPDGAWGIHLVLSSKKLKGDSLGNTREVPIADYVDIGVFGDRVPGQTLGEPLLVKKVRITQPVTVLDFVLAKEPKKAGIDPYNKLIDRTPEDNVRAVVRR